MNCLHIFFLIGAAFALYACGGERPGASSAATGTASSANSSAEPVAEAGAAAAFARGPHNGRLLEDGNFVLELAIYETGVPPEFRAWATENGQALRPGDVSLEVALTRLDETDKIEFRPQADFLRSTSIVHEPHSFVVSIDAGHEGRRHHWEYESFEGRTRISPEMAEAFGLETSVAGPAVLEERVALYGRIVPDADRLREIRARFDGAIRSVAVSLGQTVGAGQVLAEIESNESLKPYTITAPITGVVTERSASAGEQTAGRRLFTIIDTSSVWANLAVFLDDRARVRVGAPVTIASTFGGMSVDGKIAHVDVVAGPNQAVTARVVLDNGEGAWALGTYLTANVRVAEIDVPLAVERKALQPFRDFMVVYAQVGDVYEVRMLELGRRAGDWVEVLGGLKPGTRYVTENSYVLKADIEKSGASHDH